MKLKYILPLTLIIFFVIVFVLYWVLTPGIAVDPVHPYTVKAPPHRQIELQIAVKNNKPFPVLLDRVEILTDNNLWPQGQGKILKEDSRESNIGSYYLNQGEKINLVLTADFKEGKEIGVINGAVIYYKYLGKEYEKEVPSLVIVLDDHVDDDIYKAFLDVTNYGEINYQLSRP